VLCSRKSDLILQLERKKRVVESWRVPR
jgi:hypothetical protein